MFFRWVVLLVVLLPGNNNNIFVTASKEHISPEISFGELPFSLAQESNNTNNTNIRHSTIPEYVIKYAPAIHLYSEEKYLPYDINEYVKHFVLKDESGRTLGISKSNNPGVGGLAGLLDSGLNGISSLLFSATADDSPLSGLSDLSEKIQTEEVRNLNPEDVYLSAIDDFSVDPEWITGKLNIPDIETGELPNAPAVLIVVDKGNGTVDAFWFCFYSFNLGPFVMGGGPYGNHIGDWEHSLVRFQDGKPVLLWMSAHGGGSAYEFQVLEKLDNDSNRPVLFSARGTHANYATVGQHSHDIPYHMLSDFTDRGSLWDLSKNYLAYTYDGSEVYLSNGSVDGREDLYGDWLSFLGHWGDKKLPPDDPRQRYHPFEWLMIDGPTGPLSKNLLRRDPCQRSKWWNFSGSCKVRRQLLMGEGIEGEGGSCARILDSIRPYWLQWILQLVTSGGFGCFIIDQIWG